MALLDPSKSVLTKQPWVTLYAVQPSASYKTYISLDQVKESFLCLREKGMQKGRESWITEGPSEKKERQREKFKTYGLGLKEEKKNYICI